MLELGLVLALTEAEGLRDELGLTEADGDNESEALALGDSEELGLRLAEGLRLELGDRNEPGDTPNQSTPGRGPGWPSSYKKQLSASSRAVRGRRDLSISEMTPSFQLLSVKNCGSGKVGRFRLSTDIGMV